ncbi:MAG: helix-turn-helix domain-containing protein [Acidobacteria bacterium]|nr:helix-turn-helix domain-containing protein [Acidobacteriota bacterium]
MNQWTFLTNHAHILLAIAQDPEIRMKDAAAKVGITERAAQRILADLLQAGYLTRQKVGRRNHYQIHAELPLRHPLASHQPVNLLLALLDGPEKAPRKQRRRRTVVKRTPRRS